MTSRKFGAPTICHLQVFPIAKELADCVIPAEYGISAAHKLRIGKKIAAELIGKLLCDLENSRADCEAAALDASGGEPASAAPTAVRDRDPSRRSTCLLYTSPSPRDRQKSRMPSSA